MLNLKFPRFWLSRNFISFSLLPLAVIFFVISKLRKIFAVTNYYDQLTICVGNAIIGGAGKTPLVLEIYKQLIAKNYKVLIVTKGYKSKLNYNLLVQATHSAEEVGDEAKLLSKKADVAIIKDYKKFKSFLADYDYQILIFDDGYQNPYFAKDVNILTVSESRLFGNKFLLPAGPLRQFEEDALKQADYVAYYGQNKEYLAKDASKVIKLKIINKKNNFKQNFIAFAAIGEPEKFYNSLRQANYNIIKTINYPDHYYYSEDDYKYLNQLAAKSQAKLITTEKDLVKIDQSKFDDLQVTPAIIEYDISELTNLINYIDEKYQQKN